MVIAIDGPAGAGKSTVARGVAGALGFTYLDSGAMYRSAALAWPRDPATLDIAFAGDRVLLDGEDVSAAIRTPEVSQAASRLAADPAVRAALVPKQRALVGAGDWVAEGRDIGTVVAPDAEVEVFLTADPTERARRSVAELGSDPEVVLREQTLRDERDRSREAGPLAPAPDAVPVDTTALTFDEVVEQIVLLAVEAKEIQT
jgi:CMP/dCMP kinase